MANRAEMQQAQRSPPRPSRQKFLSSVRKNRRLRQKKRGGGSSWVQSHRNHRFTASVSLTNKNGTWTRNFGANCCHSVSNESCLACDTDWEGTGISWKQKVSALKEQLSHFAEKLSVMSLRDDTCKPISWRAVRGPKDAALVWVVNRVHNATLALKLLLYLSVIIYQYSLWSEQSGCAFNTVFKSVQHVFCLQGYRGPYKNCFVCFNKCSIFSPKFLFFSILIHCCCFVTFNANLPFKSVCRSVFVTKITYSISHLTHKVILGFILLFVCFCFYSNFAFPHACIVVKWCTRSPSRKILPRQKQNKELIKRN